jgi:sugar O-acyltransferase (sialic acid O-acetyltransferase NeuD family)
MGREVLIYGAGLLGLQVLHQVNTFYKHKYTVLGFIDDIQPNETEIINRLRVIGGFQEIKESGNYPPNKIGLISAIGYSNMKGREQAFLKAKEAGYTFETLIHANAFVDPSATIGMGTIITAGVIIDQTVSLGENNYIDIGVRIGENCVIKNNNYFSSGATIAGSVHIGDNNFFGLNCTVVDGLHMGNHNFINAAALVYRDMENNQKLVEVRQNRIVGNL